MGMKMNTRRGRLRCHHQRVRCCFCRHLNTRRIPFFFSSVFSSLSKRLLFETSRIWRVCVFVCSCFNLPKNFSLSHKHSCVRLPKLFYYLFLFFLEFKSFAMAPTTNRLITMACFNSLLIFSPLYRSLLLSCSMVWKK